jgi:hypothetical protein
MLQRKYTFGEACLILRTGNSSCLSIKKAANLRKCFRKISRFLLLYIVHGCDRQWTHNVTLRRVCVPLLPSKISKYYMLRVCAYLPAWATQHADRMHPIVFSSTVFPVPPYFPTLSHKRYYEIFTETSSWTQDVVWDISHSKKNSARYY